MDRGEVEWDAARAESILEKHGLSFEAACRVFRDAFAFDRCDFDSEPCEIRFVITGMADDAIVIVVYTE